MVVEKIRGQAVADSHGAWLDEKDPLEVRIITDFKSYALQLNKRYMRVTLADFSGCRKGASNNINNIIPSNSQQYSQM